MLNHTHKGLRRQKALRRNKPAAGRRRKEASLAATNIIGEQFATAILSGDKRDMDRILREIAEIMPPPGSPREFLDEFLEMLSELLARTAHQALRLRLLQEHLRNQALTDDLTGLHNRRGFFALAGQQLKFGRRRREPALLFFADIDGLKQINDRFGHAEGDAAIRRIARVLQRTFRDSDIVARLSGDEFSILACEANAGSQREIRQRLEKNLNVEAKRDPRYRLSLSIGAARFDPHSPLTLHELLDSADRAMYEAKRARAAA